MNEERSDVKGDGVNFYFEVEDLDEFYKKVTGAGVKIYGKPVTQPWGKKELIMKDLDGYRLVFFENISIVKKSGDLKYLG